MVLTDDQSPHHRLPGRRLGPRALQRLHDLPPRLRLVAGRAGRGRAGPRCCAPPPSPASSATAGRSTGVRTDRGELSAPLVIACDGVNSFLAKEAGLHPHGDDPEHFTLGVKEVLALPRHVIDERFGVRGDEGVDIEVLGCTGDVPGGGFVYTNAESVSDRGGARSLPALAASGRRPESFIADLKAHPAIAPLVEGATSRSTPPTSSPRAATTPCPRSWPTACWWPATPPGCAWPPASGWRGSTSPSARARRPPRRPSRPSPPATPARRAGRLPAPPRVELRAAGPPQAAAGPALRALRPGAAPLPQLACDLVEQLFTVDNPRRKKGGIAAAARRTAPQRPAPARHRQGRLDGR